jgi:hypothetical protein
MFRVGTSGGTMKSKKTEISLPTGAEVGFAAAPGMTKLPKTADKSLDTIPGGDVAKMLRIQSYKVRVSGAVDLQIRQIAQRNNLTPEQVVVKGVATLLYLDRETMVGHKATIVDGEGNTLESDLFEDVILQKATSNS